MGDADDSYDFSALEPFVDKLREGADLVMGNRFAGGIAPGAMPWLHRYLGNPVLSAIGRLFFRSPIGDFHCGLRGFRRDACGRSTCSPPAWSSPARWSSRRPWPDCSITEVPTTLAPGRPRPPAAPAQLARRLAAPALPAAVQPALAVPRTRAGADASFGLGVGAAVALPPIRVGGVTFDVHTLVAASVATIIGFQAVPVRRVHQGVRDTGGLPAARRARCAAAWSCSRWSGAWPWACCSCCWALAGLVVSLSQWQGVGFGDLNPRSALRLVVPSATGMVLGCQTVLASLFLSILRSGAARGAQGGCAIPSLTRPR